MKREREKKGELFSNSCHASLAVVAENWSHENVQLYLTVCLYIKRRKREEKRRKI